jgi:hypothetical protein
MVVHSFKIYTTKKNTLDDARYAAFLSQEVQFFGIMVCALTDNDKLFL